MTSSWPNQDKARQDERHAEDREQRDPFAEDDHTVSERDDGQQVGD